MPVLGGYQYLDNFGELQLDPAIPIIITAPNQGDQVVDGLRRGANNYVTKPFGMEELTARIDVQLKIAELECRIRRSEA
jgi:two-component system alkaline phosphatase synthesis response regulator PhoP